jgi:hypothetical protein
VSLILGPGSLRLGDETCPESNAAIRVPAPLLEHFCKYFFIIFVDGIFTTSFERLFTKYFDVPTATPSISCV